MRRCGTVRTALPPRAFRAVQGRRPGSSPRRGITVAGQHRSRTGFATTTPTGKPGAGSLHVPRPASSVGSTRGLHAHFLASRFRPCCSGPTTAARARVPSRTPIEHQWKGWPHARKDTRPSARGYRIRYGWVGLGPPLAGQNKHVVVPIGAVDGMRASPRGWLEFEATQELQTAVIVRFQIGPDAAKSQAAERECESQTDCIGGVSETLVTLGNPVTDGAGASGHVIQGDVTEVRSHPSEVKSEAVPRSSAKTILGSGEARVDLLGDVCRD